jgi:hypothetical protein
MYGDRPSGPTALLTSRLANLFSTSAFVKDGCGHGTGDRDGNDGGGGKESLEKEARYVSLKISTIFEISSSLCPL